MISILLVFALVAALLLAWWFVGVRSRRREEVHAADTLDTVTGWPPQATRVLTTGETEAYDLLRTALPAHMVLAQVPLQRFIKVPTRNSYSEWLRRVGQLSVDMLVCDRHSQVIAVVEVQAANESVTDRALRRRERLLKVLKASQIPVHLWSTSKLPTVDEVRAKIAPPPVEVAAAVESPAAVVPPRFGMDSAAAVATEATDEPDSQSQAMPLREPPPSTWFDDFDSAPVPLTTAPAPAQAEPERKDRPLR